MQAARQGVWIPQACDPESVGDCSEQAVEPAAAADDQVVHGSYSVGGSSGNGRQQVDSSPSQQLTVHSSPDVARLKAALSSELSLQKLSVAGFIKSLEAFRELELHELEELIRRADRVSSWLAETGGGFQLDGRPVRKHKDSLRRPLA